MPRPQLLPSHSAAHPAGIWRLQTLGALCARNGDIELHHFPSRQVAGLLAWLALAPDRDHPREVLCELLWPGVEPVRARNSLRNALSTLNKLLQVPGAAANAVIEADRRCLRLPAHRVLVDALEFEALVRSGRAAQARACWRGEFLPGHYDEWINDERLRLQALYDRVAAAAVEADPARTLIPVKPAPHPAPWRQLPYHHDGFFGRDAELAELAHCLADEQRATRLVWITGPAGSGKSRLAAEFGARVTGFDAVVWVPLLACSKPDHVLEQVRAALGLHAAPVLPLEQIAARLHGMRSLLLLDNLEHLLGPARSAAFVMPLLQRLPRLKIVATSQQLPRLPRGQRLAVAALALPALAGEGPQVLQAARQSPAVQLFVSRARQRRADFSLHAGNATALTALCRGLQGWPLAIELAAGRVRELSPQRMQQALAADPRWPARNAQGRHAAARHASLANALAWSWGLLSPPQQQLLAALAVLRGSFGDPDAAGVSGMPLARCRRALQTLEALSMLQPHSGAAQQPARWLMLEAVRDHALQTLDAGVAAQLRQRHRAHFSGQAQQLAAHHRYVHADTLPDMLHAVETGLADGEPGHSAQLLLALRAHWVARGTGDRVLALMQQALDNTGVPAAAAVQLTGLLAQLRVEAGQAEAAKQTALRAQALALRLPASDTGLRLEADLAAASVAWRIERDGAAIGPLAQQLLQRADAASNPLLLGRAAMLLGAITWAHRKDHAAAEALFVRARGAFAAAGDPQAELAVLPGYTACLLSRRQLKEAVALGSAGAEQARLLGDVNTELLLLNRVAEACAQLRRHAQAVAAGQRQARVAHEHGMAYHLCYALWNQCYPLARLGRAEAAAQLMAFSARWWAADFAPLQPQDQTYIARVRSAAQAHLSPAAWQRLWAQGQALAPAGGIALGLSGCTV
jgi:predicted ATPase